MALFNHKNEVRRKKALALGATYTTPEGREVFRDMIIDSGLFQSIDATDPEAIPRHNMMAATLYEMGILNDEKVDRLVDSLLDLRYKE